jgi:hypothetical protein
VACPLLLIALRCAIVQGCGGLQLPGSWDLQAKTLAVLTKYESMKIPTVLWLQCSQHGDELALTDHALRWTSIEASTDASIGASTAEAQRGPICCDERRLLQLQVACCTVFYHHAALRC